MNAEGKENTGNIVQEKTPFRLFCAVGFDSLREDFGSVRDGSDSVREDFGSVRDGSHSVREGSEWVRVGMREEFGSVRNGSDSVRESYESVREGFESLSEGFEHVRVEGFFDIFSKTARIFCKTEKKSHN